MRKLIFLLIIPMMSTVTPANAAEDNSGTVDEARPENTELQPAQSSPGRVERPKQETVKMSPTIRISPRNQEQDGKMRRTAPAPGESPLLNMPAPRDMTSPQGDEPAGGR